jgi:hypothetical protein
MSGGKHVALGAVVMAVAIGMGVTFIGGPADPPHADVSPAAIPRPDVPPPDALVPPARGVGDLPMPDGSLPEARPVRRP